MSASELMWLDECIVATREVQHDPDDNYTRSVLAHLENLAEIRAHFAALPRRSVLQAPVGLPLQDAAALFALFAAVEGAPS